MGRQDPMPAASSGLFSRTQHGERCREASHISQAQVSPERRIFCHKTQTPSFCLSPDGCGVGMLNQFLGFGVCCRSLDSSELFSVALCWGGCEHKGPRPCW